MTPVIAADSRLEGLAAEVGALTWYHTIELPGGIVTPGEYDTRTALRRVPFPSELQDARCLDVGTHDGFWAFEMERRGAREVVAIDLEDPRRVDYSEPLPSLPETAIEERSRRREAFSLAHTALGSRVQRRDLSVYDLASANVGAFEFAFIGTLLLHLRDPVAALSAIASVLAPGGRLLVNDGVSLWLSMLHPRAPAYTLSLLPGRPFWWVPNARGLRRYVEKAGLSVVSAGGVYLVLNGPGFARPVPSGGVVTRALHRRGMPHAWVLAEKR
jgi:tRNA (mo5U34)-methyltransferase